MAASMLTWSTLYSNQLTESQKNLLDQVVKPEEDGLREFIERKCDSSSGLEELDSKYRDQTLDNIIKLLNPEQGQQQGLTKEQIKGLIQYLNLEIWFTMEDTILPDDMDQINVETQCLAVFDIDHSNFHWTMQLVDEAELHAAKKRLAFSKALHERLGVSSGAQVAPDIFPIILGASLRKSKRKRKSKKPKKPKKPKKSKKRKKS